MKCIPSRVSCSAWGIHYVQYARCRKNEIDPKNDDGVSIFLNFRIRCLEKKNPIPVYGCNLRLSVCPMSFSPSLPPPLRRKTVLYSSTSRSPSLGSFVTLSLRGNLTGYGEKGENSLWWSRGQNTGRKKSAVQKKTNCKMFNLRP